MKIYDCFTFYNELDLLELRLNYLNDCVDYFVIVESDKTFSGINKPYFFEDNKDRFKKFKDKIILVHKELNTEGMTFVKNPGTKFRKIDDYWKLEHEQRNSIMIGLNNANDEDIIIVGDVDEIPNRNAIEKYKNMYYPKHATFVLKNHYYYFNCINTMETVDVCCNNITSKKNLITTQGLRDDRYEYIRIKNGGWHFSYLGGVDNIINKIKSFSHSEYNNDKYLNKNKIQDCINNGKDLFDRNIKYVYFDINMFKSEYPEYLIENLDKFNKYIKKIEKIIL